jgi:tetratricopeptide (TPR) repeat protein
MGSVAQIENGRDIGSIPLPGTTMSPLRSLLMPALAAALLGPLPSHGQALPRLGVISFPTSAGPDAQRAFDEGVLWMHSFEYAKAATAFRRAQQAEPGFALAYWGEAMTHNHPVWNERDAVQAQAVLARLGPTAAARAAKARTPREAAWLNAAEVLWADGPKAVRDSLYEQAMARLARDYPDDESLTFHALAILGLKQGVRDIPDYMRAGKIALDVFRRSPSHPGAAHFVIHAFDDPDHAILGLDAARAYSVIAPAAGHAQHMTTHIFLALGMWDEVARQNVVAMQAVRGDSDSLNWTPGHYTWWLHYARLQQGKWRDANRWLQRQTALLPVDAPTARREGLAQRALEWQFAVGLFDQVPYSERTPEMLSDPFRLLAWTVDAWRREMTTEVATLADRMTALRQAKPDDTALRLLEPQARAIALQMAGRSDSAIRVSGEAVRLEASLPMDFGPPAVLRPAHEGHAELLLALGRHAEAQVAFHAALARMPGRSRTLAGLVLAARGAGDTAAADRAMAQLQANFHAADAGAMEQLLGSFGRRR